MSELVLLHHNEPDNGANKCRLLLTALNGICEDALGDAHKDPGGNLYSLDALEMAGLTVPPYLRQAVMEYVIRNSSLLVRDRQRDEAVYFILDSASNTVKIGFTTAKTIRLSQIQSHNSGSLSLLGSIPGGRIKEKELHDRFLSLRVRGEWFAYKDELKAFIAVAVDPESEA